MPVMLSGLELAAYVRRRSKEVLLSSDQVEGLAQALVQAGPCNRAEEAPAGEASAGLLQAPAGGPLPQEGAGAVGRAAGPTVRAGQGKDGRVWVRVVGSRDEAEKVRAGYAADGRSSSSVKRDRLAQGAWFFYLDGE